MKDEEIILDIPVDHLENIFGQFDANIQLIESTLNVTFVTRGDTLKVLGPAEQIKSASDVMNTLYQLSRKGETITKQEGQYLLYGFDGKAVVTDKNFNTLAQVTPEGSVIPPPANRSSLRRWDRSPMWMLFVRR